MRLHYLRGDRAAAIAVSESLIQVLGRELGLRPSIETNADHCGGARRRGLSVTRR